MKKQVKYINHIGQYSLRGTFRNTAMVVLHHLDEH